MSESSSSDIVTLNVKAHTEKNYKVETSLNITVAEMKNKIEAVSDIKAELQRLIYSGQVLRDERTLADYKIQNNHTIHLVARAVPQTQPAPQPQPQPQQAQPQPQPQQAQPAPQGQQPQIPPNLFANLFGQQAGQQGGQAQGQGLGGQQPFPGLDPNVMLNMLNNPMIQQSMNQLLQNPQLLQQMLMNNPMAAQLVNNNPVVQQLLNNPEVLQQMANPDLLNQVLRAQMAQQGVQQGAQQGQQIDFNQLFQQMGGLQGMGGLGPMANFGAMYGANLQQPGQPANAQPPEERYAIQLQQLQDMGFNNRQVNLQALATTNGNVEAAVERLLMG
jgi:ubiquilin